MRVAIDLHGIPKSFRYRGNGRYIEGLQKALVKYLPQHQITISEGKVSSDIDVIHYPFFDFFRSSLPLYHKVPFIVTIHDVIPLACPSHYPKGIKGSLIWQRQKYALSKAYWVVTDAPSSIEPIVRHTGFPQGKITSVPLAISEIFTQQFSRNKLSEISVKFALPKEFILYVGDGNWNKNVETLITAAWRSRLDVVLVGKVWLEKPGSHVEQMAMRDMWSKWFGQSFIHRLGPVSDEDLAAVYKLALAYVQPSFAEGFSFPILEALTSGCPVVASDISVHHDLADKAVLYFDPSSPNVLGKVLETIRGLPLRERRAILEKGVKRSEIFSWQRVAVAMGGIYEKAALGR